MNGIRKALLGSSLCLLIAAFYTGACGGGSITLTAPTIEQIRSALGANNPDGMVPESPLGEIILPPCTTNSTSGTIAYSITDLPAWLAFDITTRAVTLASGTEVPGDAMTAADITYSCNLGTMTDSVTFTINDLDGGGVVDGLEYRFGEVPLLNSSIGWIWLNPGNASLYRATTSNVHRIPTGVVGTPVGMNPTNAADDTADFDGDGLSNLEEIIAGTNLFVASSTGTYTVQPTIAVGTSPQDIIVADLNGDGGLDTATTSWADNNVAVLLGNGDGTFDAAVSYATGTDPRGLVAADLDGDGDVDLAAANSGDNTVSVLKGNGDGTFATHVDYTTSGTGTRGLVAADLDGDGDVDLAATNDGDSTVSLLLNNGDGTFPAAPPTYATGTQPFDITAADFDGDGDLDLLTANYSGKTVSFHINNGDGTFTSGDRPSIGGEGSGVTVADFDGDGDIDVATANYSDAMGISILLNNNDGTFASHVDHPLIDYKPTKIIAADIDGDGDMDLAVTGAYSKQLALFFGNGDGTFGDAVFQGDAKTRNGIAAADFNGEGKLDIATASSDTGFYFVQVFLNQ